MAREPSAGVVDDPNPPPAPRRHDAVPDQAKLSRVQPPVPGIPGVPIDDSGVLTAALPRGELRVGHIADRYLQTRRGRGREAIVAARHPNVVGGRPVVQRAREQLRDDAYQVSPLGHREPRRHVSHR